MEETIDFAHEENEIKGIPMFLKVLCILTFVGSGIGILGSIYNIFAFEFAISQLENQKEIFSNGANPFGDMSGIIEATKKWGMISYSLSLVGSLLCLTGALFMWKLKKIGFFSYLFGSIVPFIGSILLITEMKGGGNGFMGAASTIGVIISGLITAAFVIMYAANFKHLK